MNRQQGKTNRRQGSDYQKLTFRHAVQLAAPHSWAASLCPALFGVFYCLLTGKTLYVHQAIGLVLACLLMQAAVNTINDLVDYLKGTDQRSDHVAVSDATLVYENLNPKHVLYLAAGELLAGALLGILCSLKLLPILIGVIGGIVVILYSAGPFPLCNLPVGEIVSGFVMGGLIPFGIAAATDGKAHWNAIFCSVPMIISIGLIMMSNNGCDIEKDKAAGRKTLPVLLGRENTVTLFRVFLSIWIVSLAVGPLIVLGWVGLICPALLVVFVLKDFIFLYRSRLKPEKRIEQMQHISRANLLGNGAMILSMMVAWIIQLIAG